MAILLFPRLSAIPPLKTFSAIDMNYCKRHDCKSIYIDIPDKELIEHKLCEYGICVLQSFFDSKALQSLNKSVSNLNDDNLFKRLSSFTSMASVRGPGLKKFQLDLIAPSFRQFISDFFCCRPFEIEESARIHYDADGADINTKWHQDPDISLKFFTCLDGADEHSGALMYDLGSHIAGFYRMHYARSQGVFRKTLTLEEHKIKNPVSVNVNAGDLIIFNTAGMHRAGGIDAGLSRTLVRWHYYKREREPGFSNLFYPLFRNCIKHPRGRALMTLLAPQSLYNGATLASKHRESFGFF